PGNWNDPDYIQIGYVGSARGKGMPKPCPLYPSEQYAYMSLWALMASPLFFSGDMSQLDAFTLNVLCNPEVIAVSQDPLGKSGRVYLLTDDTLAMVKHLADGSTAVGLFNRGEIETEVALDWKVADLVGTYQLRDLWRQEDIGSAEERLTAVVSPHGVVLVRLQNPKKQ
ncbi:MAG: alpha-galactosidase, partial [bacterium]